jgi:hypothetical protein
MKINLSNYEEFMLDYLEGNPDESATAEMRAFLLMHPHIEQLTEDLSEMKLSPANAKTSLTDDFKSGLHKPAIVEYQSISEENFETFFIAFHENDLNEGDKNRLMAFLERNPQLVTIFNEFGKIKMGHDPLILFSGKESLYRRNPQRIKLWISVAAAAAFAALAFWLFSTEHSQPGLKITNPVQYVSPVEVPHKTEKESEPLKTKNTQQVIRQEILEKEMVAYVRETLLAAPIESLIAKSLPVDDMQWKNEPALNRALLFQRNQLKSDVNRAQIPKEKKTGIRLVRNLLWKTTKGQVRNMTRDLLDEEIFQAENYRMITDGIISVKRPSKTME